MVLVPALVKTKSGELVYSLTANDFSITDNGIEQKVMLDEASDQQPLALVVAIQNGDVSPRQFHALRGMGTMLEAIVGDRPHQVALVTFAKQPQLISGFTPDLSKITGAIQHLTTEGDGAAILDATAYSLKLLERQPKESRRCILLISEMRDQGSLIPLKEVVSEIGESNTVIYSLAFSSLRARLKDDLTGPGRENPKIQLAHDLPPTPDYLDISAAIGLAVDALRKNTASNLAQLTGGEYLGFSNQQNLDSDLNTIANHLPNRYLLSFQPVSPQPGLHSIAVKVKGHPDFAVSARTRYWAAGDTNRQHAR